MAIFLLLLYRFLGVVAVIGLAIYGAFMYAAIVLLGVTLTLPGFAGLILTIGVAADANVVVFERIKEESRAGKSVRAAISAGYAKGFRTILDANAVTAITALILFAVATAGVKGFALMLLIGTVDLADHRRRGDARDARPARRLQVVPEPALHGRERMIKYLQIDYMGRRKLWFAISGTVVLISLVSLATRGLNLGIDFKGGVQITFKTTNFTPLSKVRAQMKLIGHEKDAVVQGRGNSRVGRGLQELPDPPQEADERRAGQAQHGARRTTCTPSRRGSRTCRRASASRSRARPSIAVIFSLLIITLYIAVRFHGLAFAVPVIVALIHDIVITVGVYSLTGREVTESTVAAVLTVLGYSIYDTIIIFDRIRENIPIMRRASFATIANVSLWETIRRSLATTFITLLPVAALFFFGGSTLQDFAFALLIGVTSGAYSSIFIAAPLLTIWKEREPEFARRKDNTSIEGSVAARLLRQAEVAAAEEPTPATPVDVIESAVGARRDDSDEKRERRRQRRKARPHGRAR